MENECFSCSGGFRASCSWRGYGDTIDSPSIPFFLQHKNYDLSAKSPCQMAGAFCKKEMMKKSDTKKRNCLKQNEKQ